MKTLILFLAIHVLYARAANNDVNEADTLRPHIDLDLDLDHQRQHPHYVLHEQRQWMPLHWEQGARVDAEAIVPLRIGLTQQNVQDGYIEEKLMQISHPASDKYGQHLSAEETHALFQPS